MYKKFVIDIDGVVATKVTEKVLVDDAIDSINYFIANPIQENIDFFNKLYDEGHTIVYFTARGYETGINWSTLVMNQFSLWGVKYHDIIFGKPSADYYIDDKALNIEKLEELISLEEAEEYLGIKGDTL